jgi:mono/diheme cytochrome c family protein
MGKGHDMNSRFTTIAILLSGFWLLAAQSAPQIKKTTASPTSPTSGKDMYVQYCATCHGKEGKGDGPAAKALKAQPTNLTTLTVNNHGTFPDFRIARVIEGNDNVAAHGSRDMPIWGEVFNRMDAGGTATTKLRVENLTGYIKSLQTK